MFFVLALAFPQSPVPVLGYQRHRWGAYHSSVCRALLRQGSSSPTQDPHTLLRSAMRPVSVAVVLEVLSVPTGQAPPAPPASLGPGAGVLGVCAWVEGACPATGCPSE